MVKGIVVVCVQSSPQTGWLVAFALLICACHRLEHQRIKHFLRRSADCFLVRTSSRSVSESAWNAANGDSLAILGRGRLFPILCEQKAIRLPINSG